MRRPFLPRPISPRQFLLGLAGTLLLAASLFGALLLTMGVRPFTPAASDLTSQSPSPRTAGQQHGAPPPAGTAMVMPPDPGGTPVPPGGSSVASGNGSMAGTPSPRLPLLGRRIALDPGHGPRGDLGAVLVDPSTGKLILSEAEFNLDVAKRCQDILRARGAGVMLTRETADTFTAPWPVDANGDGIVGGPKDELQTRVDILNAFHSEVFLSVHANNAPRQRNIRRGVQVFYCSTSDCLFAAPSRQLGQLVLDNLQDKLALAGYPVQSAQLHSDLWLDNTHLFLLGPVNPPTHVRAAQMPGVLAESLYLTSPVEGPELKRDDVRQAIALAYADALQAYLTAGK